MTRYVPPPRPRRRLRDFLRGVWGVIALLVGAVDALLSALLGIRPLAATWHAISEVIADRWRMASHDAIDAEVIGEEED